MAAVKKATTTIEEPLTEKVAKAKPKKSILSLPLFWKNLRKLYGQRPKTYLGGVIILLIAIGVFCLVWFNKGLFLAGNINGRILTSPEFYNELKKASGQTVFDSIVRETLIKQEATKLKITASKEDVDKKIQELEKSVGGKDKLDAALAQNQATIEDLRGQLTIQVLVEKILADQIKVTDAEIDKYIADNKEATAKLSRDEVKDEVKTEKLNEKFSTWYQGVESKAKITQYF